MIRTKEEEEKVVIVLELCNGNTDTTKCDVYKTL